MPRGTSSTKRPAAGLSAGRAGAIVRQFVVRVVTGEARGITVGIGVSVGSRGVGSGVKVGVFEGVIVWTGALAPGIIVVARAVVGFASGELVKMG